MQIVLVIDRDADERDLVLHMLNDEGFAVRTAATADEGISILEEGGIDAVVVPTSGGDADIDFLVHLRTTYPLIPVVAIGGGPDSGTLNETSPETSSLGVVPMRFNRAQIAAVLNRVQLAAKASREQIRLRCLH